ncbi:mechanosensitive ion channel family protein [Acerihabitans sp. TG2]|uniref:mechanosensitive ion channel family protein n=1 Tax=Acerihabitans sp. TG2 TaxID=3096008 RepID=UPI002B2307C5|nr:mechanosensitive ion channel family protein [Acerihabitans sp. TG2]MEA9392019.1 mechanosensitive ion channel family protein [Acerihabitans sp. TG2]
METLRNLDLFRLITSGDFWLNIAIIFATTIILYLVITKVIMFTGQRLKNWSAGKHSALYKMAVGMLDNTKRILIFFTAFLVSLHFIELSISWQSAIDHGWFLLFAIQIALWLDSALNIWSHHMINQPGAVRNTVTMVILGVMIRLLIWALMLLSILGNIGVNITALVASLGVGGIAIALAIQTVLSDVFASLAIGFDKPFVIGDFVVFNDIAGTIEHIGLKTTRIRSLSGEQIVCANAILLQQTIHNYKRMQTRRIVFTFGLAYSTPPEKLRNVGPMLKSIIEEVKETSFDRAHFLSFDNYRLTFEVVHIVASADYNQYMDIQQEINIRLMEELEKMDIKLAIPTQNILFTEKEFPQLKILESGLKAQGHEAQG